jgi:hypothetical protein
MGGQLALTQHCPFLYDEHIAKQVFINRLGDVFEPSAGRYGMRMRLDRDNPPTYHHL